MDFTPHHTLRNEPRACNRPPQHPDYPIITHRPTHPLNLNILLLNILGARVRVVGPSTLLPTGIRRMGAAALDLAYVAAGRKNDAKRLAQAYLLNPMLSSERMKSSKETLESLAK